MLRLTIILTLFTVVLGSCTRENKTTAAKKLLIGLPSTIASYDPILATDDPNTQLLNLFYHPLLSVKQEAQEWPKTETSALKELPVVSQDGMEIQLKLKTGLHFEDSAALNMKAREANSKDLVVTILRNGDRRLNARYADLIENIVGVKEWFKGAKNLEQLPAGLKILDSETVVIRLKESAPSWWYNLSVINFSLVPAESFGKQITVPSGTGFYSLKESSKDQLVVTKKSGTGPDEIIYRIFENRVDDAVESMKKNSLDALPINSDQATTWFDGTALKKEFKEAQVQAFYGLTSQYVALLLHPNLKTEFKRQLHVRLTQNTDRAFLALYLGSFLTPCNSLYRCDAELPPMKKYDGKDILKVKVLLSAAHGDTATREALSRALKDASIEASFVDGTLVGKNDWKADMALIDLNMSTYDPTDLLVLGNAPKEISSKMFAELASTKPSANAFESLAVWSRDESDLVTLARRRAAAVGSPRVGKISFNIQGWLDPRGIEMSGK